MSGTQDNMANKASDETSAPSTGTVEEPMHQLRCATFRAPNTVIKGMGDLTLPEIMAMEDLIQFYTILYSNGPNAGEDEEFGPSPQECTQM